MEAIATVRAGGRALLLSASHAESPVSTVLIVVPLVGSCGPTTRPWLRIAGETFPERTASRF